MTGEEFRKLLNEPNAPGMEYIANPGEYERDILNGYSMSVVKYGFELDQYCPAKLGQLTCVIGHTTVGKTTVLLWLLSKLIKAGRKVLIYSAENRISTLHRNITRFITGQPQVTQAMLDAVRDSVKYIEHKKHFTYKEMLNQSTYLLDAGFDFDYFLIDPYNSLRIDPTLRINTHEYHYQAADEMRIFTITTNKSIFLNCHTVTEAQRVKPDANGHRPAPLDADVEGGAKFPNKADDTIVIHRQVSSKDPEERLTTELHVRKVRNKEFGGDTTPWEEPMKIKFRHNWTGFDVIGSYEQKLNDYKQMNFYEPEKEQLPDWVTN